MRKRMLLVEDDQNLAKMYATKFAMGGWNVEICPDGAESISMAKDKDFEIVVLDLMLPGLSGIDVLEILRQDPKTVKTPIIVYTNFGDNFNREKCMTYGADEFILKVDATPESLLQIIESTVMLKGEESIS